MQFKPLKKKQYTPEQLQEYKFTDSSLLGLFLDSLDSFIRDYNGSKIFNADISYDLCTIRELCDTAYNNNVYADNSMVTLSHLRNDSGEDIIRNYCKMAIFALMSIN